MFGSQIAVPSPDLSVADMFGPQWFGDLGGTSDSLIPDEYFPTPNLFENMALINFPGDELFTGASPISVQTNLKISVLFL